MLFYLVDLRVCFVLFWVFGFGLVFCCCCFWVFCCCCFVLVCFFPLLFLSKQILRKQCILQERQNMPFSFGHLCNCGTGKGQQLRERINKIIPCYLDPHAFHSEQMNYKLPYDTSAHKWHIHSLAGDEIHPSVSLLSQLEGPQGRQREEERVCLNSTEQVKLNT